MKEERVGTIACVPFDIIAEMIYMNGGIDWESTKKYIERARQMSSASRIFASQC